MYDRDRLDKAYEHLAPAELINAPVDALQGLSKRDAGYLLKAFYVKTIGDLAELKYARWAREICELADSGAGDMTIPSSFKEKLDKKYEKKSALAIAKLPVHALQGVSKGDAVLLQKAFKIKTVRNLADLKYYDWAVDILDESRRLIEPATVAGDFRGKSSLSRIVLALMILAAVALGLYYFQPKIRTAWESRNRDTAPVSTRLETAPQPETPPITTAPGPEISPAPAPKKAVEPKKEKPQGNVYVVQVKDDLISISEKVYGNYQGWLKIYEANKDTLKSPILIFPGQQLTIPDWIKK